MRHTKSFLHILLFFVIFSLISTQFFKVAFNSENNNTSEISIEDEDCPEDPPERPGNQECDNENKEIITSLEKPSKRPKATRARPLVPQIKEKEKKKSPGVRSITYWDPIRKRMVTVGSVAVPPIRNVPDPSPGDW